MKLLIQRGIALGILLFVVAIAFSQNQVAAKPGSNSVTFLPIIMYSPPPTAAPTPRPVYALGPVGSSTGGDAFTDYPPDTSYVTQILIYSGMWVDNIQFVMNTGAMSAHGGSGGQPASINLVPGEYVVAFTGTSGCVVYNLWIQTNLRTFGPFGWASGYDDPCNNASSFNMSMSGYEIVGIWGNAGWFFDHLGVLARIHQ